MHDLIAPKDGDHILISLKNGREITGTVKSIIDSVLVIHPFNKTCLCIVSFEEISCYYLTSKEIDDYLNKKEKTELKIDTSLHYDIEPEITGETHEERIESIIELRNKQKEIEKEEIRQKLTTFAPSNHEVSYGIPTKKQPVPESIINPRKKA